MNLARLLILALSASALVCPAQDKQPAAKPGEPASSAVTPALQAPPSPPPAAGTATEGYIIGPADLLTVTVWKEPTFSGPLLVRPDGMISVPLLGDVPAAGLTPLQLADQIAIRLKKFILEPNVSVVLTQINSKKVYLMGEVAKKGPVDLAPGMTLLEAISSAGGLTDYANTKKIYILRDEAGKHLKIDVHYKEALKGNSEFNVVLQPGDTIVVP